MASNVVEAQIAIGKKAKAEKHYNNLKEDGWDIVIDPIETLPEKTISAKKMAALVATNWGRDALLPADIRTRLIDECVYPVIIKIGDTGDPNHSYLKTGHLPPSNYTTAATAEDKQGHSTHVTGIIAANELGLLEALVHKGLITYKACKVLGDNGSGSFSWVANMFNGEYNADVEAIRGGTFVVYNMSLGGGTAKVAAVEEAMKKSTDAGVFIAVANGNTGGQGVQYPGNSIYVIATASLDQNLARSSYSTYGPETMVAMPGRSINSTYLNNSFASLSGTSMATPFNAATIAIARSKWGTKIKSLSHLRAYLAKCATDLPPVGRDEFTGFGIEYVKRILDTDPSSVPDTTPEPPKPVDPDSLTREVRTLTIPLKGEWKMVYNPTVASKNQKVRNLPDPITVQGEGLRHLVESQATSTITITAIEVSISTKYYFPLTHKTLLDGVNWFFKNRGLQLSGASDLQEGLNWSAYFLDLLLYSQRGGINIDVLRIEGKDPTGRSLFISGSAVKKYTPK